MIIIEHECPDALSTTTSYLDVLGMRQAVHEPIRNALGESAFAQAK